MITTMLSILMFVQALRDGSVITTNNKQHADAFEAIEEALLSSKSQRNLLQETFFSSSRPPPMLLTVIYNVTTSNSSHDLYTIGWSRSSVFAVINPETVWALQSGILSLAFLLEGIAVPHLVSFDLNITNIKQHMSSQEIMGVLRSITERLKHYAIYQEKLTNWDGSNMGFIWDTENSSRLFLVIIIIADALLILFASIFSAKLMVKFSRKMRTQEATVEIGLFWSLVTVAQFPNFLELFYLFLIVTLIPVETFTIIKASFLTMALLLGLIGALVSCTCNRKYFPPYPKLKQWCCFSKSCCTWYTYCSGMYNFFLFVYFTTLNIIPAIILAFVHPVIVLSTVTFIYTSFFCVVQVFVLLFSIDVISEKFQSSKNEEESKQQCIRLCKILLYSLPLAAIALLMVPYLNILSSTEYTHSSELFSDLSSFLPSIIIGAIGMFVRRKLKKKSKNGKETDERVHASDPIKMAEEGVSLQQL